MMVLFWKNFVIMQCHQMRIELNSQTLKTSYKKVMEFMPSIINFSICQVASIGVSDTIGESNNGLNLEKFEEVIIYSQNFWLQIESSTGTEVFDFDDEQNRTLRKFGGTVDSMFDPKTRATVIQKSKLTDEQTQVINDFYKGLPKVSFTAVEESEEKVVQYVASTLKVTLKVDNWDDEDVQQFSKQETITYDNVVPETELKKANKIYVVASDGTNIYGITALLMRDFDNEETPGEQTIEMKVFMHKVGNQGITVNGYLDTHRGCDFKGTFNITVHE